MQLTVRTGRDGPMRILLVEDEKSLSRAITAILEKTTILWTRCTTEQMRWRI